MTGPITTEIHDLQHFPGTGLPVQSLADVPPPAVPMVAAVSAADGSAVNPEDLRGSAVAFYCGKVDILVAACLQGVPEVVGNDCDQLLNDESTFVVKTVQPAAQRDLLLKDWPHDTPELRRFRRAAFADVFYQRLIAVDIEGFQRLADASQHPALIAFANCALNAPKNVDPKDHLPIVREWFSTSPFGVADFNDSVVNLIEAAAVLELFVRATDRPQFLLDMRFGSVLKSSGHSPALSTGSAAYAAGVRQVIGELIERQPPELVIYLSLFENAFAAIGPENAPELDQRKFSARVGSHTVIVATSGRETARTLTRLKLNLDCIKLFDEFCGSSLSDRPLDQLLLQFLTIYRFYLQLSSLTEMPLSSTVTLSNYDLEVFGSWTRRACRNELLQWGNVLRTYHVANNDPDGMFHVHTVHARDRLLYGRYLGGGFSICTLDNSSITGCRLDTIPSSPIELRVGVACRFMHYFAGIVTEVAGRIRAGKPVLE